MDVCDTQLTYGECATTTVTYAAGDPDFREFALLTWGEKDDVPMITDHPKWLGACRRMDRRGDER